MSQGRPVQKPDWHKKPGHASLAHMDEHFTHEDFLRELVAFTQHRELVAFTQDIGSLREAYTGGKNRATILRMAAAKCEHAGAALRHIADGLDEGLYEIV